MASLSVRFGPIKKSLIQPIICLALKLSRYQIYEINFTKAFHLNPLFKKQFLPQILDDKPSWEVARCQRKIYTGWKAIFMQLQLKILVSWDLEYQYALKWYNWCIYQAVATVGTMSVAIDAISIYKYQCDHWSVQMICRQWQQWDQWALQLTPANTLSSFTAQVLIFFIFIVTIVMLSTVNAQ